MFSLATILENIKTLIENYWQVFIFEGVKYTLILSAIAVFFGSIFGVVIALGRMSNWKPLRFLNKKKAKKGVVYSISEFNPISFLCSAYTEILRDTPLLLQLYLFVIILPTIIKIADFSMFTWTSIALALNSAAYVSELIRSGIQAVDKGQTMIKVVLPQAVKNILPAIGSEFVTIIKETSMASTFFIGDLMTSYLKVKGATYLALEALIIVAVIYFILTFFLSKVILAYERRLNSK